MNRSTLLARLPLVAVMALAMGVAACNKPGDSPTAGQKLDSAIADTKQAANSAANKTSEAMNDATIVTKINAALVADDKLKARKIDVSSVDGRVTLAGTAPDTDSQSRATTLAAAVEGVHSVDNQLVVTPKG